MAHLFVAPEYLSPEWHLWRQNHIGASDVPIIMGHDDYKSVRQLWLEKTGATKPDMSVSNAAAMGHALESMVVGLCHDQFELAGKGGPECWAEVICDPVTGESFPLVVSLDGTLTVMRQENEQERFLIVESKTVNKSKFARVMSSGLPLEEHWIQVQAQLMACPKATGAVIGYLCRDNGKFKMFTVYPDGKTHVDIAQKCAAFWASVMSNTEPETEPVAKIGIGFDGLMHEADPVMTSVLLEYDRWRRLKSEAESNADALRDEIVEELLSRKAKGFYSDTIIVTGSRTNGRQSTDWAAVAKEAGVPQTIIAKHTTTGDPSWRLTVRAGK